MRPWVVVVGAALVAMFVLAAEADAAPVGFVVSPTVALVFSPVYAVPSGELALFLGASLPARPRRPGHWVALGYRVTGGVGGADMATTSEDFYLFAHHHHLAVQGVAGRRGRLVYGASVGVAGFAGGAPSFMHIPSGALAVEAEGRIGRVLGRSSPGRVQGVFGAQLRLSGGVWPAVNPPFPVFGLFIGLQFGRRLPLAPPRRRDE